MGKCITKPWKDFDSNKDIKRGSGEASAGNNVVIHATHDYNANDKDEISFRKYDMLHLLNNSDDEWLLVEHRTSKERGYVPCNHVALGQPKKRNRESPLPDPDNANKGQQKSSDLQSSNSNLYRETESDVKTVTALYNYEAKTAEDLTFRKHDRMELIDASDDVWWLVEDGTSKQRGYVPCNHVALGPPKKILTQAPPPDPADANKGQQNSSNCQSSDSNSETKSGVKIVTALYDYEARTTEDLTFRKRDRLELIDESDIDWLFVKHCANEREGYVPSNFVTVDDSFTRFDWFLKIPRFEATRMISAESNQDGMFLVRESETKQGLFTLTMKFTGAHSSGSKVKHYRIQQDPSGGYYVSDTQKFTSLEQLVIFYRAHKGDLCCKLTTVCPKPLPVTSGLAHELKDHWEIERSALVLGKQLGSGNFGSVHQGLWNGATPVAVKTLKAGSMSPIAFLEEAKVMKECKHDHLVQLFAVYTKDEPIYIVTELMCNGSLKDHLMNNHPTNFTWALRVYMAAQVAEGMAYLSLKPLIHRDLAARNVLVGEQNLCKIADFGMARLITDGDYMAREGSKFPIKWTAPEALSHRKFSVKSDVWSFGILMVEIVTLGGVPYPGQTNVEVIEQILRGYRHPQPHECPTEVYDIMKRCWQIEVDERPSFEQILVELNEYMEYLDNYALDENE